MSKGNLGYEVSVEDGYTPPPKTSSYKGPQTLSSSARRDICGFDGVNSDTEGDGACLASSHEGRAKVRKQGNENRDTQTDKQKQVGTKVIRAAEEASAHRRRIDDINTLGALLHANGMHRNSAAFEAQRRLAPRP